MKILQEVIVPQETVNDEVLTVVKLYFETGDKVEAGDTVIDLETSKAVIHVDAGEGGYIEYLCQAEDEVEVGSTIIHITDTKPEPVKQVATDAKEQKSTDVVITPSAQALIKKHNLNSEIFSDKDIVTKDDVLKHLGLKKEPVKNKPQVESSFRPDPDLVGERKRLPKTKMHEIEYLSAVQSAGLNSTVYVNVEVDGIFDAINKYFSVMKGSILPLICYEVSRLLVEFKEFNAYYDQGEVVYYREVNLGLAMDIDDGLKVVTLRGADADKIGDIEKKIFDLANSYIDKELGVSDLTGSTFTITDLSAEGVTFFTPLINIGQSAILGISSIDEKLKRITLSLTFDHRVTEGKRAVHLLRNLKERLESYLLPEAERVRLAKKDIRCFKTLKSLDDLSDSEIGMIKVIKKNGEEVYISDLSLLGF